MKLPEKPHAFVRAQGKGAFRALFQGTNGQDTLAGSA